MVDDRLATNVGRNLSGIDDLLAVGTGDAAMTIGTSASLRSVLSALAGGQFPDVTPGVSPLPGPRGDGSVLVGGAGLWIVDRAPPEKQEAARRVVRWLLEPEQQAAWHAGSGYIPIRRSAVELPAVRDLWAKEPEFAVAYRQFQEGRPAPATIGPVIGAYQGVREAMVAAWNGCGCRALPRTRRCVRSKKSPTARSRSTIDGYNHKPWQPRRAGTRGCGP